MTESSTIPSTSPLPARTAAVLMAIAPISLATAQSAAVDNLDVDSSLSLTPTPEPRVISTDRPSFSNGTGIQPRGTLNLETGYLFTFRDRDGVETTRHNGPEVLARVGVIEERLELRFITSGYTWSRSTDDAGSSADAGWSDIAFGAKLLLAEQDGVLPRLALNVQSTLGGGADNISTQQAEPLLSLIWSYDLAQSFGDRWSGFTLGGNANIAWPTTDGDRFTQGQGSVYLSFPVAGRVSGFAEYFVIGPFTKGSDAAHFVDFGGVYLLTNRVQLDARIGFGLNDEADNLFVGAGISFAF